MATEEAWSTRRNKSQGPDIIVSQQKEANTSMTSCLPTSVWFSLVIPTYNESENIAHLLARVYRTLEKTGRSFEIIIVDDDSPDETWKIAQRLSYKYPCLKVIRRINERGLARAVVRGWEEARGEILAVMDGDLQHPPETLSLLIKTLGKESVDIVVASRHVRGGGVSKWKLVRRTMSWGATLAATWFLPGILHKLLDPMSGYFALRRAAIEGVRLNPEGYKILLEVLCRGRYRQVEELPYTFIERERGGSKLGARQYFEFVSHLLRLSQETGELTRFIQYCLVGFSGILVNAAVVMVAVSAGIDFLWSGILGVEFTIIMNFLLNELWTFQNISRQKANLRARLNRFLRFNSFCAGGAVIYVGILTVLTHYAGFHYLLSSLVSIFVGTLWNYGMNANITWTLQATIEGHDESIEQEFAVTQGRIESVDSRI
jgi:dolichol-phosphate mannosyltransferase